MATFTWKDGQQDWLANSWAGSGLPMAYVDPFATETDTTELPPSGVIVADLTATATGTVSDGAATEGSAPITATVQSAAPVTVINHAGSPTGTLQMSASTTGSRSAWSPTKPMRSPSADCPPGLR